MKECNKCHVVKTLSEFNTSKTNRGGYATRCRVCIAQEHQERKARRKQLRDTGEVSIPAVKECRQCHEVKPLSDFAHRTANSDGRTATCKQCVAAARDPEQKRQWYRDNKERQQEMNRERKRKNADRVRAYNKSYRAQTKEQRNAYNREWYERNKEHARERSKRYNIHNIVYESKRRTLMEDNGGSFTAQEWRDLCTQYDNRCLRCGKRLPFERLSIDHVVPVTRGGSSDITNLQPLCRPCNSRKNTKAIDYRPIVAVVWPLLSLLES